MLAAPNARHLALMLAAALLLGAGPAAGQDEHEGWVFGTRAFASSLAPVPSELQLDRAQGIFDLWQRALREGPAFGPPLARALEDSARRGDAERPSLLAALGLCGGPVARDALSARLRRRAGAYGAEEFVFAAFSLARPRVAADGEQLRAQLAKRQREPVETLSVAITALALAHRHGAATAPEFDMPPDLRGLYLPLRVAIAPGLRDHEEGRPSALPAQPPRVGTFAELQLRAELLALVARPGTVSARELRRVLAFGGSYAELASFALGCLDGEARAQVATWEGLDLASYLAGAERVEDALQERLLLGADAVRPARWRARYWAAAMRLVATSGRDSLLALLLEREAQIGSTELLEPALEEWARRQLEGERRAQLDDTVRVRLRNVARQCGGALGRVLTWLAGGEPPTGDDVPARPRALIDLGLGPGDAALRGQGPGLAWLCLQELRWIHPPGGAASTRGILLQELNTLIFDVFVRGGDVRKQHWPVENLEPWLPAGISRVRHDYFRLLELLLERYPVLQR